MSFFGIKRLRVGGQCLAGSAHSRAGVADIDLQPGIVPGQLLRFQVVLQRTLIVALGLAGQTDIYQQNGVFRILPYGPGPEFPRPLLVAQFVAYERGQALRRDIVGTLLEASFEVLPGLPESSLLQIGVAQLVRKPPGLHNRRAVKRRERLDRLAVISRKKVQLGQLALRFGPQLALPAGLLQGPYSTLQLMSLLLKQRQGSPDCLGPLLGRHLPKDLHRPFHAAAPVQHYRKSQCRFRALVFTIGEFGFKLLRKPPDILRTPFGQREVYLRTSKTRVEGKRPSEVFHRLVRLTLPMKYDAEKIVIPRPGIKFQGTLHPPTGTSRLTLPVGIQRPQIVQLRVPDIADRRIPHLLRPLISFRAKQHFSQVVTDQTVIGKSLQTLLEQLHGLVDISALPGRDTAHKIPVGRASRHAREVVPDRSEGGPAIPGARLGRGQLDQHRRIGAPFERLVQQIGRFLHLAPRSSQNAHHFECRGAVTMLLQYRNGVPRISPLDQQVCQETPGSIVSAVNFVRFAKTAQRRLPVFTRKGNPSLKHVRFGSLRVAFQRVFQKLLGFGIPLIMECNHGKIVV